MAVKPIVKTISPWDTEVGTQIYFTYSGNTPVANRAMIYDAASLKLVYDVTRETTSLFHWIDPGVLKPNSTVTNGNGNKYCIQIEIKDNTGATSMLSDKAYFWCFSKPDFYYTTPIEDESIITSNINLNLVYSQAEDEQIHNYRHSLYDSAKTLVMQSDAFFDSEGYNYTFKGLSNKTSYYLRTEGVTRNGMSLDTGYVRVNINYYDPEKYEILILDSDTNATVYGQTQMICIDANEDEKDYVFFNSMVRLISRTVTWESNYNITGDFSMQLKISNLHACGDILTMYNKERKKYTLSINQYLFDNGTVRYCLRAFNGVSTYTLYSRPLNVLNTDVAALNIRRKNNIYSLDVIIL